MNLPEDVAVDSAGNLYIADTENYRIREVSNGVITTVAGNGLLTSFSGDGGAATSAQMYSPQGVAVDSSGNVYIADTNNNRVRMVSNGVITTVAGTGTQGFSGDGGPATSAELYGPIGVAVDTAGNLYIVDNGRIRKVSGGVITTVAGRGTSGLGDNGPATSAQLGPEAVAVDSAGNLYIADLGYGRIREVSNGVITTVAGGGTSGLGDNGPATSAHLGPEGVAVDSAGNLYIADTQNGEIRKVSNGVITTVAGVAPKFGEICTPFGSQNLCWFGNATAGFSGDTGPATSAELNLPQGVAVDSLGNLYIADTQNNRIRRVSNGVIATVAGGGSLGDNVPAISALLEGPTGVAVDTAGNVYIADTNNNRIRLPTPSGTVPAPFITAVYNAASNLSGAIAPGKSSRSPARDSAPLNSSPLKPAATVSTTRRSPALGCLVQFNGVPAAMIYTSATQLAAVVPYEVTGTSAQVTVTYQGPPSASFPTTLAEAAPGLFTLDSTGQGQAAAVNQDGTINGASTPAPIGNFVSLYATGAGQTSPAGIDGKPATAPFPAPNLPVTVTIGGVTVSSLQYAGAAPGEVAGLLQINVAIPTGITPGSAVPVAIAIGGITSPAGVTLAVSAD